MVLVGQQVTQVIYGGRSENSWFYENWMIIIQSIITNRVS